MEVSKSLYFNLIMLRRQQLHFLKALMMDWVIKTQVIKIYFNGLLTKVGIVAIKMENISEGAISVLIANCTKR